MIKFFGVRCLKVIVSLVVIKVYYMFEGGILKGLGGIRVGDKEVFCGKYLVKNFWFFYKDEEIGMILG